MLFIPLYKQKTVNGIKTSDIPEKIRLPTQNAPATALQKP